MRASATSSYPQKSQPPVVPGTCGLYQPEGSFDFYRGGRLPQVNVAYETWGRLSAKARQCNINSQRALSERARTDRPLRIRVEDGGKTWWVLGLPSIQTSST